MSHQVLQVRGTYLYWSPLKITIFPSLPLTCYYFLTHVLYHKSPNQCSYAKGAAEATLALAAVGLQVH